MVLPLERHGRQNIKCKYTNYNCTIFNNIQITIKIVYCGLCNGIDIFNQFLMLETNHSEGYFKTKRVS